MRISPFTSLDTTWGHTAAISVVMGTQPWLLLLCCYGVRRGCAFRLERGSGACQSRNSSQRVCDSVTAARVRRSRRSDCAMRPRLADAPPAGLPTPAPSHTPTTAQALRTDVCRRPTAGHGAGAARRPGAEQPARAHQRQDRPLHTTTQSWSAVVRAPGAAQQPIQRRHGVTHHHFDPPPSPRAARGTRHPIVHTSVGSAIARKGTRRDSSEVFLKN